MLTLRCIVTMLLLLGVIRGYAQTDDGYDAGDHHAHHRNEIAVANSLVRFVNEKEFSYGLHFHYVRHFSHSKFGIGAGYERIFDAHRHHTIGIVGSYRPIEACAINISPGVTFEGGESDLRFALHLEGSYEFEVGNFHIGPVLEVAFDPEDYHISIGLHVGLGF